MRVKPSEVQAVREALSFAEAEYPENAEVIIKQSCRPSKSQNKMNADTSLSAAQVNGDFGKKDLDTLDSVADKILLPMKAQKPVITSIDIEQSGITDSAFDLDNSVPTNSQTAKVAEDRLEVASARYMIGIYLILILLILIIIILAIAEIN